MISWCYCVDARNVTDLLFRCFLPLGNERALVATLTLMQNGQLQWMANALRENSNVAFLRNQLYWNFRNKINKRREISSTVFTVIIARAIIKICEFLGKTGRATPHRPTGTCWCPVALAFRGI